MSEIDYSAIRFRFAKTSSPRTDALGNVSANRAHGCQRRTHFGRPRDSSAEHCRFCDERAVALSPYAVVGSTIRALT